MKRCVMVLALASASVFPGLAADSPTDRSPITVERLILENQTQILGSSASPIPFFTATHDGLYRANVYIQAAGDPTTSCFSGGGCTGAYVTAVPGASQVFASFLYGAAAPFALKAGQSVAYFTAVYVEPAGQPYDVFIVVEEL